MDCVKCKSNHSITLTNEYVVNDDDQEDVVDNISSGNADVDNDDPESGKVGGTAVVGAGPVDGAGVVNYDAPDDAVDPGSDGKAGGTALVGAVPEEVAEVVKDDDLQ